MDETHSGNPPSKNSQAQGLKNGSADSARSSMTEFFITMRYELRQPLCSIIGYCEILLEDAADLCETDLVPDLEKILASSQFLLGIVDTTLDTAIFEQFDSRLDLESVAATIRHDLRNPLNSIIGYCELLLEEVETRSQKALIPDLQKIHLSAEQLLKLINSIINLSQIDTVPIEPAETETKEPSGEVVVEGVASVLLADDNYLNRALLTKYLERQGFTVSSANNGRQAVEMLLENAFDLVLLDIKMPEMDGFEVLGYLKANSKLRHIPVIVISAMNQMDSVVRCIEMGAEDYLPIPLNRTLLKARLGACLEKKRLRDLDARRLEELASTVEQLKISEEKAQAASRAKSIFLASMSHELRTPLNAILGFSQLMVRDALLSTEHRANVETIMRSGEHLLGLINDVLSIAKIESGKLVLTPQVFDLHHLIKGVREIFSLRAQTQKLEYVVETSPELPQYVYGDQGKLRQILINLIGNAFKFTEKGGIKVQVSAQGGRCAFKIEDTGCGIAPNELDKLFEPFVQTQSGLSSQEGTGLGLAITRNFVRLMEGDISVRSELGQGTVFSFDISLPVVESVQKPTTSAQKVIGLKPGQPAFRILVVDDRKDNREALLKLLSSVGFEVCEATNGKEAIQICVTWQPHLIWMDLQMPVLNGLQATQIIRDLELDRLEETQQIEFGLWPVSLPTPFQSPIIIGLSASVFEQDRKEILEAGCDDFVIKPLHEDTVFEKMAQHLGVEYILETDSSLSLTTATSETPLSTSLSTVPQELSEALKHSATLGDITGMLNCIDRIQGFNEPLALKLRDLAKQYRLDEIQELCE